MPIDTILNNHHGVAHRSSILDAGISSYELGRARHRGRIQRVRRAWYASLTADPRIKDAVRVGGSLSCHSALAAAGVWVPDDGRIHVAVPANASRLRSASSRHIAFVDKPEGVVLHWRVRPGEVRHSVDDLAIALGHYAQCTSAEFALAAIDCALGRGLVTVGDLESAFPAVPSRLLALADRSAGSGLETLARYRLGRLRIRVRTQVTIADVGRVDLLIGDRLVLELDGYGFHATGEAFESDRRRDLALHALGYRVVRLSFQQVMTDWETAEHILLSMVRRGDHRWPRRRS